VYPGFIHEIIKIHLSNFIVVFIRKAQALKSYLHHLDERSSLELSILNREIFKSFSLIFFQRTIFLVHRKMDRQFT